MEISSPLREAIINKRKEQGLSLTAISERSGKTKLGKPELTVSTLSAIEKEKLRGVKEDTLRILADILQLDVSPWLTDSRVLRIAFGPCCWAAPLINSVVKDIEKNEYEEIASEKLELREVLFLPNLSLSCYIDNSKIPAPLVKYNHKIEENQHILTANETYELLLNDKVDIAFLPVITAKLRSDVTRIARCMNTGKGGVYLLIIWNGNKFTPANDDHSTIQKIQNILTKPDISENACSFLFPKNTIAQYLVEGVYFDETNFEKRELEITTIDVLKKDVVRAAENFFKKQDSEFFVFAGWDVQIDALKVAFAEEMSYLKDSKLVAQEFDSYHFTKKGEPFPLISYDCVTLPNKHDYIRNHPGLMKLFSLLRENVNELNQAKGKKGNSIYRLINNFLDMKPDFTNHILNRINWEFLIYPEMFEKNLK